MEIIGAGLGRTGTLSLKMALEQLGFGPCYHMEEVIKRPHHIKAWHDVGLGQVIDWGSLFNGYQSTVDFPACIFYKELLEVFPNAKVLLSVRDPERWYESTRHTIYTARSIFPAWLQWLVPPLGRFFDMNEGIIWQGLFQGEFENRQRAIEIFRQHTEAVKVYVPAEQLLVYNVKEGWEPLCRFLNVSVPVDRPFPHANNRATMIRRFRILRVTSRLAPVAIAIGGLYLIKRAGAMVSSQRGAHK
jgi:hypothetical protein